MPKRHLYREETGRLTPCRRFSEPNAADAGFAGAGHRGRNRNAIRTKSSRLREAEPDFFREWSVPRSNR